MKKTWTNPAISDLALNETTQNFLGVYYDGGYIGDGHIGILTCEKPKHDDCQHS